MNQPTLIDVTLDLRPGDEIVCGVHRWRVVARTEWPAYKWETVRLGGVGDGTTEFLMDGTVLWILNGGGKLLRDGVEVSL